jgi:hypothetical protein
LSVVLGNKNIADKKTIFYANILNNVALGTSGILFCINIVVNVFIQIDINKMMNKQTTQTKTHKHCNTKQQ